MLAHTLVERPASQARQLGLVDDAAYFPGHKKCKSKKKPAILNLGFLQQQIKNKNKFINKSAVHSKQMPSAFI